MSQNAIAMPLTGVYSGTQAATYINNALDTLSTKQSGSSAPSSPELGWDWLNTSVAGQATWNVYDGTSFCPVGTLDETNHLWTPPVAGGTIATIASGATTDLGSKPQANISVTGITTITSFGTSALQGQIKFVSFTGILTLTYNATSLVLPTAANITTAAGDTLLAQCQGGGNWVVIAYQRASGSPLLTSGVVGGTFQLNSVITASPAASQNNYAPAGIATANTVRLTPSASINITGLAASNVSGQVMLLRNENAAGGFTFTLTANDANSTAANRFGFVAPITVNPGQMVAVQYDTTASLWRLFDSATGGGNASALWASFKNLQIKNNAGTPNSIISITADELVLEDAAFNTFKATGVNTSVNSATSGAGGLDTGTLAASTFYSLWVIYNPTTNTQSTLMSASATSPTMPSGYTFKMRVSWQFSDASKNFMRIVQDGRRAQYTVVAATNTANMPIAASGVAGNVTTPTWVSESLAAFVPSTASVVFGSLFNEATGTAMIAPNSSYGANNSTTNPPFFSIATTSSVTLPFSMLLESLAILYASNLAATGIAIQGWEDNI